MYRKFIGIIVSVLVFMTGCNQDVFISEEDKLTVSAESLEVSDTGGTFTITLNQKDWYIQDVLYLIEDYAYYEGDVTQDGVTASSTQMQMKGLGEIRAQCDYNGFKVIRDKYDELTIILGPNFTYKECELRLYLAKGIQTQTVTLVQKPSEGFVIDRVEWNDKLTGVGSTAIGNADNERKYSRRLYIEGLMSMGDGSKMWRSYLMKLLDVDSIRLPIPDPYPVDMTLTFSGEYIDLLPNEETYYIDMRPVASEVSSKPSISPNAYAKFITYHTDYSIYVRHVREGSIELCFTGSFSNESPDLK